MKAILFLMMILSLAACKGKDSSSGPDELDPRLFDGSGQWRLTYLENSVSTYEHLTFTGDEVQYEKVWDIPGNPQQAFDKRISLTPIGTRRVTGVNVADASEVWRWSYLINGNILRMCDEQDYCVEFTKL